MIKARPVAGDWRSAPRFLDAIRPFVWRRGLDFAAIADIHAMKRRIDAHKGGRAARGADPVARIAGHNVKLGEGGIREIEFLAQTLQLVWGGRDPGLREPTTLGALRLLVRAGHAAAAAPRRELAAAYRFLRRVEHRLQMVADRQTHALPASAAELARFAIFMGYAGRGRLRARAAAPSRPGARALRRAVRAGAGAAGAPAPALDFSGLGEPPPATVAALRALGFRDTARDRRGGARLAGRAARGRCARSGRGELMGEMLPALLAALGRAAAARRGVRPASTRSCRACRPGCSCCRCSTATRACSTGWRRCWAPRRRSPTIWRALPAALEGLLRPDASRAIRPPAARRLRDARLLEDVDRDHPPHRARGGFPVSVADAWRGGSDADAAGLARTALADAALARAAAARCWRISPRATAGCAAARWRWWRWARPAGGR